MTRTSAWSLVFISTVAVAGIGYQSIKKVGDLSGRKVLVNTGQVVNPEGQLTLFPTRPVDFVLSADGSRAFIKENSGLTIVSLPDGEVVQRLAIPGGSSLIGLALSVDETKLYYSNSRNAVSEIDITGPSATISRNLTLPKPKVGGEPYPCGLLLKGSSLFVAASRSNQVVEFDLDSGNVKRTFDVAPAPFALAYESSKNQLWVTSWGISPSSKSLQAKSSGTPVAIDRRGIATNGALNRINLVTGVNKISKIGTQAGEINLSNGTAYIPISNGDAVIAVGPTGEVKTVWKAPLGSAPSSVARLGDGNLAVTLGGNNEIAIITPAGKVLESYRSAWYPIGVKAQRGSLYVASSKGMGSRGNDMAAGKFDDFAKTSKSATPQNSSQRGVYQFTGAFSMIQRDARKNAPTAQTPVLAARKGVKSVAIPQRPGEPSLIKHVVYVLKENRTYDQVFGDMPEGDGDPNLCIYPENVTPNHHALAREFSLLDNYYCNGVLSADGHSWSTEGNVTGYFERSFGGWTRSYPFGDDPIAISQTGHIWDAVLDAGRTFRNYGEYDYATPSKGERYLAILKDFQSGVRKIKFKKNIGVERLRKYTHPECPGWNMEIPDVLRASYFVEDVKKAEKTGKFANFSFVYLPQDHTSGMSPNTPTTRACMADNDLALGQVVEAVSKSKFWKETAIFVIEDDPQAGFDHVDGHRSLCLVVSPYTRRGSVVSEFYNQASVLRTMRQILGIQPASKFERDAQPMFTVFQNKADLTPYRTRPNNIPLDEMNPARTGFRALPLSKPDQADEDELNQHHWVAAKGDLPYPREYAGAHGKGLSKKLPASR